MVFVDVCKKQNGKGNYIVYHNLRRRESYLLNHDPIAEVCTEIPMQWDIHHIEYLVQKELRGLYDDEEFFHQAMTGRVITGEEARHHKEIQKKIEFLSNYTPKKPYQFSK